MKKIIALIASVLGLTLISYGQGTVSLNGSTYLVTTNTGTGTSGLTGGNKQFYYTVLVSTYGGATPSAISLTGGASQFSGSVGSGWTWAGIYGTNNAVTKGGIQAPSTQSLAPGIWDGGTVNGTYTGATTRYYEVIGWSANEGSDWGTISNSIVTGTWSVTGAGAWFGASLIGFNYSGGNGSGEGATSLFATSAATGLLGSGLTTALVLSPITAVPEPSTMALAALGGASLLLFRRRQSK